MTAFLIERVPDPLWALPLPGVPRKSIRSIATHLHDNRCRWVKQVGGLLGVASAEAIGRRPASRDRVLTALRESETRMAEMFAACAERGGVPDFPWRNVPPDLEHFVAYHVAHEAHHRGQIVLVARQLGHPLPPEVVNGLWQWTRRSGEAG